MPGDRFAATSGGFHSALAVWADNWCSRTSVKVNGILIPEKNGVLGRQNHIYSLQIITIKGNTCIYQLTQSSHKPYEINTIISPFCWWGNWGTERLVPALNGSMEIRCSAQCLAHSKCSKKKKVSITISTHGEKPAREDISNVNYLWAVTFGVNLLSPTTNF